MQDSSHGVSKNLFFMCILWCLHACYLPTSTLLAQRTLQKHRYELFLCQNGPNKVKMVQTKLNKAQINSFTSKTCFFFNPAWLEILDDHLYRLVGFDPSPSQLIPSLPSDLSFKPGLTGSESWHKSHTDVEHIVRGCEMNLWVVLGMSQSWEAPWSTNFKGFLRRSQQQHRREFKPK